MVSFCLFLEGLSSQAPHMQPWEVGSEAWNRLTAVNTEGSTLGVLQFAVTVDMYVLVSPIMDLNMVDVSVIDVPQNVRTTHALLVIGPRAVLSVSASAHCECCL